MKKLLLSALSSLMMMATGMDAQAQNCSIGEYNNNVYITSSHQQNIYAHKVTLTEATVINTLSTEIGQYELDNGTGQGRFILMKLTANNQMESIIASPRFSYSTLGYVDVMMDDVTLEPGIYALFNFLPTNFESNTSMYSHYTDVAVEGYFGATSICSILTNNIDADLSSASTISLTLYNQSYLFNRMHMSYTAKEEIMIPICAPTYMFNGVEYTENTTVYHNRRAGTSATCDSITATRIEFVTSINQDQNISQCDHYTWPVNGETYTESTVVTFDAGQSVHGCDSTVTLYLTINARPSAELSLEEYTLSVPEMEELTYQWFECNQELISIQGATSAAYTPASTGSYAVMINNGTCLLLSECMTVEYLSTDNLLQNSLTVYPNPTTGSITLSLDGSVELTAIELIDLNGKVLQSSGATTLTTMNYTINQNVGVYFLKLVAKDGTSTVIRLIKE